jgi:phosphopantetheinyl transferase
MKSSELLSLSQNDHLWLVRASHTKTRSGLEHAAIKEIFSLYNASNFTLKRNENGKPSFHKPHNIFEFSLSHSDHFMALAISSSSSIGVDIEHCKKRKQTKKIAKRYFGNTEQDDDAFYHAWTAREAYIKCLGESLFNVFSRIRVYENSNTLLLGHKENLSHAVNFHNAAHGMLVALCRPRENCKEIVVFEKD